MASGQFNSAFITNISFIYFITKIIWEKSSQKIRVQQVTWAISLEFQIRESCSLWVEDKSLQVVQAEGGKSFAIVVA